MTNLDISKSNNVHRSSDKRLATRRCATPFATKLINDGHVTVEQYEFALNKSYAKNISLLAALEELLGEDMSPEVKREYKRSQLFELKVAYGIKTTSPIYDPHFFDLRNTNIMINSNLIPLIDCIKYKVLPLVYSEGILIVGMVSLDPEATEAVMSFVNNQGLILRRYLIMEDDFNQVLSQITPPTEPTVFNDINLFVSNQAPKQPPNLKSTSQDFRYFSPQPSNPIEQIIAWLGSSWG